MDGNTDLLWEGRAPPPVIAGGDQRVFRSDSPEDVSSAWIPIPVSLHSPLVLNELPNAEMFSSPSTPADHIRIPGYGKSHLPTRKGGKSATSSSASLCTCGRPTWCMLGRHKSVSLRRLSGSTLEGPAGGNRTGVDVRDHQIVRRNSTPPPSSR